MLLPVLVSANADIVLSDIDLHEPRYVGILDVKNLNAAAITKNNSVGLISGKFNVNGRGFDVNTLTLRQNLIFLKSKSQEKPLIIFI